MKNLLANASPHKTARITGVAFIVMFLLGIFSMFAAFSGLIVPGDAISSVLTLIILVTDVVVALGLFILLKPVNSNLALLAAILRLIYVTLSLVFLVINDVSRGPFFSYIFFVPHIFILGYLIIKSRYIPRILGVLLIIASFGFLIANYGGFLLPEEWSATLFPIGLVLAVPAEIALGIWLVFKGVDDEQWESRAPEPA